MNEYNNESNNGPITPYRASGNLNTIIGNPEVNINDTMNINIQSMATNSAPIQNSTNTVEGTQIQNNMANINIRQNNQSTEIISNTSNVGQKKVENNPINVINTSNTETQKQNKNITNIFQKPNNNVTNNQKNTGVQRTYVTIDNKQKKKKPSLSLGPEFKIGLLIIVILLVFVLFLPMISEFFNGY